MKYVAAAVCFIAVMVGVWMLYQKHTNVPFEDNNQLGETTALASVWVTPLATDVSIVAGTAAEAVVIATTSAAADGSTVKTSASGRAILTQEQAIISSLDNNSEITLALSPDKKQSRTTLVAGKIWSKISRALEQDETFEVYTPTMVAAVRGTSFGVTLDPARSLIVTEGTVYVTRRNKETGELVEGTTIPVEAGSVVSDDGVVFTIRPLTKSDKDDWYFRHNSEANPDNTTPASSSIFETFTPPTTAPPAAFVPEVETPTPPSETITIDSVSPETFDPVSTSNVRIYGDNLDSVSRVLLNGNEVEFSVTNVGVIVVNTSEFRDGYDEYDLRLETPTGSDSRSGAFTLEREVPELSISTVSFIYDQSQNPFMVIAGTGLSEADTVTVNNESLPFTIVNDGELRVSHPYPESTLVVDVEAGDQSDRYTVNP